MQRDRTIYPSIHLNQEVIEEESQISNLCKKRSVAKSEHSFSLDPIQRPGFDVPTTYARTYVYPSVTSTLRTQAFPSPRHAALTPQVAALVLPPRACFAR